MMKIEYCKSIFPLEEKWRSIYSGTDRFVTPFQSYESNCWIYRKFYSKFNKLSYKRLYVYAENEGHRVILPLCIRPSHKDILPVSFKTSVDFNDVIADTYDEALLDFVFSSVRSLYPGYSFSMQRLLEDSTLYRYLSSRYASTPSDVCGRIRFSSPEYEDYYSSLSKHQRQNVRTAYNKLEKESLEISIEKYRDVPDSLYLACQKLYEGRMLDRHEFHSHLHALLTRFSNPVNYLLRDEPDRTVFVLRINGDLAGYMAGLYGKGHDVFYVPRLSGSMKYLRYSPGILMVNEVSKLLMKEGVRILDLTRGEESYKFMMGSEKYNVFQFDF